ncbi:MAG: GTPase ObgE [Planctomycetota bacterium]
MLFRDEAEIVVVSGRGGDGCLSFRREKFVPKGGPDGGDGGRGGDVILRADRSVTTLMDHYRKRRYVGENGHPGGPKCMTGRNGADRVVRVPVGTVVRDAVRENVLRDLAREGDEVRIVEGGRGGRGNKAFATATRQTPRFAEAGKEGEVRKLLLELKMIADVGIIGLPNAGKSTLLSRISSARPKIAAYPFTTLTPQPGIVEIDDSTQLVFADIPGLVEGAHDGIGLGHQFLRHIERTRVLLHLVDVSELASQAPDEAYRVIRNELQSYSTELARKLEVVVATKLDAAQDATDRIAALARTAGQEVLTISAVTGQGLDQLLARFARWHEASA